MRIEHEQSMKQSPLMAKNFRIILDLLEGKASTEKVKEFRKFLKSIEDGKN